MEYLFDGRRMVRRLIRRNGSVNQSCVYYIMWGNKHVYSLLKLKSTVDTQNTLRLSRFTISVIRNLEQFGSVGSSCRILEQYNR